MDVNVPLDKRNVNSVSLKSELELHFLFPTTFLGYTE